MVKKLQIAFLIFVPLIFLFIGLRFDRTKYGTDPESAYLMNGLNIASGKAVGHFDNPGTTVQIYSAIVLRVTHFFRFSDHDLQTDVLLNSEYYIEVLRIGFIVLNACVLLILGLVAFSLLGNFWAGLLLQTAPFLSVTLIEECFTKVAPEQLLFTTIALLIILLLKFYTSKEPDKVGYALLFGVLAGFGMATKMTFLPVLIIPFIILSGKRNKWIYVASIIPSFVLFTLPAVTGYLHMANWFLNLGTHTGTYGQGNSGVIDAKVYFNSLLSIAEFNKALVTVMSVTVLVLLYNVFFTRKLKPEKTNKEFYILSALLISQAGSILMVAKHYHSNHYLFPALSLTGFVLVFIFILIKQYLPEQKRKIFQFVLPGIVVVVIGVSLLNIPFMAMAYKGYRDSNKSTDETFAQLDRDYRDFVKVYYYPVSFNEYSSLRWGNVYSKQYSIEKLMQLFPEGLFYNVWEKSFQLWETNISTREFVKKYGGRILLVGGPRTYEEFKIVEQGGLKMNKLFDSRVQVVYEIDTAKSELFKGIIHNGSPVWSLQNDLETFNPDGEWIISSDGSKFSKSSALATGKARSGKYAFKLPNLDSYAMEYELLDVKPGQMYEINIWKYGGGQEVFLVASSGGKNPYYQQSKGCIETDKMGWKKVTLDFKIPEGFTGNKLTIYLWNHDNSPVWFDDFQIKKY
jgi:hypothetical protein